jgi:hypothetical protein
VRRADGADVGVLCSNAGVPFTHAARAGAAPPFGAPLAPDLFDMARGCLPARAADKWPAFGEPPLRIRVTDFEDAQVGMGCSFCC